MARKLEGLGLWCTDIHTHQVFWCEHLVKEDDMSEPNGPILLGATYIGGQPNFGVDNIGEGFSYNAPPDGMADHLLTIMAVSEYMENTIKRQEEEIKRKNEEDTANIDSSIDQNIKKAGALNSPMNAQTPPETVSKELGIVSGMKAESQALANNKLQEAKSFFGDRPIKDAGYDLTDFYLTNVAGPNPDYKLLKDWATAYNAYKVSQVYSEMVNRLKVKEDVLGGIIAEQARVAAEAEAQRVAAEQARIAAEAEAKRVADEQARIAAEAEAKRVADEQARVATEAEAKRVADEQARVAAEAIRVANTFRAPGPASATSPLFMTSAGTIAVIEAAAVTLQAAIRSAIAALTSLAAGTASGLLVGVSALVYSPKLANGELPERYAFSISLSDLAPELGQDLPAIAAAGGTVDLPVRVSSKTAADGQSEVFVAKTDGVVVPSKVRVVAATFNAEQNVYSVTTADVPPRTLTWTPIVNPGNSSTTSPAEQPAPPVYIGATVTPVEGRIDTFPAVVEAGFDDFITVFPADSGLPPIYVMFRDRREDAGFATGIGQPVTGIWLGAASQGEGAPIPSQIADQLRGKEFKNFRGFREALWKAVANDPELAKQFDPSILATMKKGRAPVAKESEQVGRRIKLELHHKKYISESGGVYDIDNINAVTPKHHIETHKGAGK